MTKYQCIVDGIMLVFIILNGTTITIAFDIVHLVKNFKSRYDIENSYRTF